MSLHLAAPRSPAGNNAGPATCQRCPFVLFTPDAGSPDGEGGASHITYDTALHGHTTDGATWDAAEDKCA